MTTPQMPPGWGKIGDWRQYFQDPALDRLAELVMDLAAEVWVLNDRQRIIEKLLENKSYLQPEEIDTYQPTLEEQEQLTTERNAFLGRILRGIAREEVTE